MKLNTFVIVLFVLFYMMHTLTIIVFAVFTGREDTTRCCPSKPKTDVTETQ